MKECPPKVLVGEGWEWLLNTFVAKAGWLPRDAGGDV